MSLVKRSRTKSPWVLHYDCGACNGCDIELLACLTPVYDVERFGIVNVGNPKHADVLVVTGTVNRRNRRVLRNLYDQMPDPKVVVAVGACAMSGGIFRGCYNVLNGVDNVVPVDAYVPGCAPKPEAIIEGIVMALGQMRHGRRTDTETQGHGGAGIADAATRRHGDAGNGAPDDRPSAEPEPFDAAEDRTKVAV